MTKEVIVEVIGLAQIGEHWYCRRRSNPKILEQLIEQGEALVKKGMGFNRTSLPSPWKGISMVVK